MPRCEDCPKDATHGIAHWRTGGGWVIRTDVRQAKRRWCKWHAIVRVTQYNVRGLTPAQVRQLEQEAQILPDHTAPP